MAIVQISRITQRKGLTEDLPQPLAGAELGWAIDQRRLFIGNGELADGAPVVGNTEILTEFSDILQFTTQNTIELFMEVVSDVLNLKDCKLKEIITKTIKYLKGNKDLRKELGIPKDKFVFGRHGGLYTFDKGFVWNAMKYIAETRDDTVFLLANTYKFVEHPNIIYVDPFFGNQEKSNFINACDAMIHGRNLGESFGGAIAVGHPLASSGVRLMINLARSFEEHPEVRYGITTMCIGLGMGGTIIWENPHYKGGNK